MTAALFLAIEAVRTRQASPDQLHDVVDAAELADPVDLELVETARAALLFMRSSRTLPIPDSVWEAVEAVASLAERRLDDTRPVLTREILGSKGDPYKLRYREGDAPHYCSCPAHTIGHKRGLPCKHMRPAGSAFDAGAKHPARGAA